MGAAAFADGHRAVVSYLREARARTCRQERCESGGYLFSVTGFYEIYPVIGRKAVLASYGAIQLHLPASRQ